MSRKFILIFICWLGCISVIGQNRIKSHINSSKKNLSMMQSRDSFRLYYKELDSLERFLLKANLFDSLYGLSMYYNYLPKSEEDSAMYRKYLAVHAQKFKNINDYHEALRFYLRSSSYAKDLKTDKLVWNIENYIGGIYARLDDYDKAIYYYKLCIPQLTSNKKYGTLARLFKEIGRTYMWLGKYTEMTKYFDQGIVFALKDKEYKGLQAIYESYADFYLNYSTDTDKYEKFTNNINKSYHYLSQLQDDIDCIERTYVLDLLYGQYYHKIKDYSQAEKYYQVALESASNVFKSKKSREIAKIYHKLAQLNIDNGDIGKANIYVNYGIKKIIGENLKGELPSKDQIDRENTFVDLLDIKSQYYYALFLKYKNSPYLDSAIMSIDLAINAKEQLNKKLILNNSKYISVATNKLLVNKGIEYSYAGLTTSKKSKYISKCRSYFDLSKGVIYKSNQEKNNIRERMNANDMAFYDKTKNKLRILLNEMSNPDDSRNIELEITAQAKILENIEGKYINNTQFSGRINSSYIEYVSGIDYYYVMTNIGGHKVFRLSNTQSIHSETNKLNELLRSKTDVNALHNQLAKLYALLIPFDLSKAKKIIIIPDGCLSLVPFDLLRRNDKYLLENFTLSTAFNHKRFSTSKRINKDVKIYMVSPQYKKPIIPSYASIDRQAMSYLPYAKFEVEALKSYFKNAISYDENPSLSTFKTQLKENSIFHFTGHAIVKSDSAYLGLTNQQQQIIRLNDTDIEQINTTLDMVALSACETGLGEYKEGEGIKSLASSFLNGGAKSIVYSLWKADDQSSATIMSSFYNYLHQGKEKDIALNLAKKDFIQNASPELCHPYFWAPFVVVGDTKPLINDTLYYWYYMAAVISIALLLFIYFKNKTIVV